MIINLSMKNNNRLYSFFFHLNLIIIYGNIK